MPGTGLGAASPTAWYHARALRAARALPWFLLLVAGCGAAAEPSPAAPTGAASADPPQQPRRTRWARFDEVSSWPAANPTPIPSKGHGSGQYQITVRVQPDALGDYVAHGSRATMPLGTVVAAFHRDARRGQSGPVYVMTRAASGWTYTAYEPSGFAAEHGVLALCERCHLEAPSGGLFGLPRETPPRD
jgi:hypothetical protein